MNWPPRNRKTPDWKRTRIGRRCGSWSTPQDFFDRLDAEFHFTLDACAAKWNAKCRRYFDRRQNGLRQPWRGAVWVNPPFWQAKEWVEKAWRESRRGCTAVLLLPAHLQRCWFHDLCVRFGDLRLVRGQLYFWRPGHPHHSSPWGNVVVIFRPGSRGGRVRSIPARVKE